MYQTRYLHVVYKKSCSEKVFKFHTKVPVPESLFDKVAGLKSAALLKRKLRHRYFPLKFQNISKQAFLQNAPGFISNVIDSD